MTAVTRELSTDTFANVVIVASSNTEVDPPVSWVAKDNDQTSPSWVGYGREYVELLTSDVVTTRSQAKLLANQRLNVLRACSEQVQVTARNMPTLDVHSLVPVARGRIGVSGTYDVQAIAWDLNLRNLMTVNMAPRRVAL